MNTLFIIAAGIGTRMGIDIPKALVPFNGQPFIMDTIEKVRHKFGKIYIVINENHLYFWDELHFPENVTLLEIKSGRGDGHAVREALQSLNKIPGDITVMWGDVYLDEPKIIDELLQKDLTHALVPCERISNPYVTICTTKNDHVTHALFSKYGETTEFGLHDMSIFRFHGPYLNKALNALHRSFDRGGVYMTQGKELSTLFVFHYLWNKGIPATAYETAYRTMSFNTQSELNEIMELI